MSIYIAFSLQSTHRGHYNYLADTYIGLQTSDKHYICHYYLPIEYTAEKKCHLSL